MAALLDPALHLARLMPTYSSKEGGTPARTMPAGGAGGVLDGKIITKTYLKVVSCHF